MTEKAFTYIIRCADGSLYTGWTVDLEQRLLAHNEGRGAKYTRGRGPVTLVASWQMPSKSTAMQVERSIKQLSRREKERLIEQIRSKRTAEPEFSPPHELEPMPKSEQVCRLALQLGQAISVSVHI